MSHEKSFTEIQALWQTQENPSPKLSLETLLGRSEKFAAKIRRRNLQEMTVAIALVALFIFKLFYAQGIWSFLTNLELSFASAYIAYHLYRHGRAVHKPEATASTSEFIQHYKAQLKKQIQLLSQVHYWYVLPLLLGIASIASEKIYTQWDPHHWPWKMLIYLFSLPFIAGALIWLNEVKVVRALKKELSELESAPKA